MIAYADESGTHDETGRQARSEVAAVAGWLARKDHWDRFTERWIQVLDHYQVRAFHMSEFVDEKRGPKKPDWPYKGWSQERRDRFIHELIFVATENTVLGVAGLISVRDYDRVTPDDLKRDTQHPYHFCLQSFFDNILETLSDKLPLLLLPWEQVAFSFEQQGEFEKKAKEIYHRVKRRDHLNRMGSITFAPKGQFKAHEAADLLVYRMRKVVTRQISGKPPFTKGSWDEALNARNHLVVGYCQEANLRAMLAELQTEK